VIKIAPSLLSADFARIVDQMALVERGGADYLHLDIMDGHFVPNLTWGPKIVGDLRKHSALPFDAHLMIEQPERYVDDFRKAGADVITVQYEACIHLQRLLVHIRSLGAKAGVALNPSTPVELLQDVIEDLDLILIMSVNPGFGGQSFIPNAIKKLREARRLIDAHNPTCELEVDGGIGRANIGAVVGAGANVIVMGSSIYGAADPASELLTLRLLAEAPLGAGAR
jgi:ribulose-phosphate 3-epimerase